MSPPSTENSPASERNVIGNFENALSCNVTSSNENCVSPNETETKLVMEVGCIESIESKKEGSKKRVSFDMNVSQIILPPERFQSDDDSSQVLAHNYNKNYSNKESDSSQTLDDVKSLQSYNHEKTKSNIELEKAKMSAKSNEIHELHVQENNKHYICDTTLYNSRVMDTLKSFRMKPLDQTKKRQSLAVTIPQDKEIPKVKLPVITKNGNRKNINIDKYKKSFKNISPNERSTALQNTSLPVSLCNPDDLKNVRICETKRNNNTQSSEQDESDIEDSFILDRELSDLAKGCLDSDSSAVGDDDSVLNFGIAASDESSLHSDIKSEKSSSDQIKVPPPSNVKKKSTKKLVPLDIDMKMKKANSSLTTTESKIGKVKDEENVLVTKGMFRAEISNSEDSNIKVTKDLLTNKVLVQQEGFNVNTQQKGKSFSKRKRGGKSCKRNNTTESSSIVDNRELCEKSIPAEILKRNEESSSVCEVSSNSSLKLTRSGLVSDKFSENEVVGNDSPNLNLNLDLKTVDKEKTKPTDSGYGLKSKTVSSLPTFFDECATDSVNIEIAERFISSHKKTCDSEEEFKDNTSPLRRIRKIKCNGKDSNTNSDISFRKDYNEKTFIDSIKISNETVHDITSKGNHTAENIQHTITDKTDLGKQMNSFLKKTQSEKNSNLKSTNKRRSGTGTEEESEALVRKNGKESCSNFQSDYSGEQLYVSSRKDSQKKENEDFINDQTDDLEEANKDPPSLDFTQVPDLKRIQEKCAINSDSKEIATAESIPVKEKDLSSETEIKNEDISTFNQSNVTEFDCLKKKALPTFGKKQKNKSFKKGKSKSNLLYSSENLRQTRSKSLIRNENKSSDQNSVSIMSQPHTFSASVTSSKTKRNYNSNKYNTEHTPLLTENMARIQKNENDKSISKELDTISRTLSTESFDEPLIKLKNKLLASDSKEKVSDILECNLDPKLNKTFKHENGNNTLQCCPIISSNKTGQSTTHISQMKVSSHIEKTSSNSENSENTGKSRESHSESNGTKSLQSIDDDSPSNNDSKKLSNENLSHSNFDILECSAISGKKLLNFTCDIPINNKVQEALRKKRDKAEVDAEIKRRLAEIDELEKLATNQHEKVLEKIGARTRSKTVLKQIKSAVDVSISGKDSQQTVISNKNSFPKNYENQKFVSSLPIDNTNPKNVTKKTKIELTNKICIQNESKSETIWADTVFPADIQNSFSKETKNNTNKEILQVKYETSHQRKDENCNKNVIISENENQGFGKLQSKDLLCSSNFEIVSKKGEECDKKTLTLPIGSPTLSEELMSRSQRNNVPDNKFKEEGDETECTSAKFLSYNRPDRKRNKDDVNREAQETPFSNNSEDSDAPLRLVRKTRNRSLMYEDLSEKSFESSRESSPTSQFFLKTSKENQAGISYEFKVNEESLNQTVAEPDSSTTNLVSSSCPVSTSTEKYARETVQRKKKTLDHSPIESTLSDISQDLDTVESSAVNIFRHPFRKIGTKRKKKGRAFRGKYIKTTNNLKQQDGRTDSFKVCKDQDSSVSEELVSSSVSSLQPMSSFKKERRKRKSFVDLLMEDSMLSVTRDFPMSPNPYILPSFYKDLENPNSKHQCVDSSDTQINVDISKDKNKLPPKPDILAQKLRLLEKLKNISRKNRKTRQCRTLVCYNEDSLPESLVESPSSEGIPQNSDSIMSSEDLSLSQCSTKEEPDKDEQSKGLSLRKRAENTNKVDALRKRGRKPTSFHKQFTKHKKFDINTDPVLRKINKENRLENCHEDTSNSDASYRTDEHSSRSSSLHITESENKQTKDLMNQNNQKSEERASEFDILLDSSFNKASRKSLFHSINSLDSSTSLLQTDSVKKISEGVEDSCEIISDKPKTSTQISNEEALLSKPEEQSYHEKIMCSILKTKIGKMPLLFGESSASEDFDEDVSLLQPYKKPFCSSENTQSINKSTDKEPNILIRKRRGRKPKVCLLKPLKQFEKKVTRSNFGTTLSVIENKSVYDQTEENQEKIISIDSSFSEISTLEPRPSRRKSNRKLKNFQVSNEEIDGSDVKSLNKALQSQEPLISETIKKYPIELKCDGIQNIPVRKRGRPPKVKPPNDVNDSKEINTVAENELFVRGITHEESEIHDTDKCFETKSDKKIRRLINVQDENLHPPCIDDKINNIEITSKELKSSQSVLETKQNVLDSFDIKDAAFKKTRAKSTETETDIPIERKKLNYLYDDNTNFGSEETDNKNLALSAESVIKKKYPRGKWPRGKKSTAINSTNRISANKVQDCKSINEKANESLNETPLNDLPPPLVKTRSRRPRNNTMDNFNLGPPHLETPFEITNHKEKLLDINLKDSSSEKDVLSLASVKENVKMDLNPNLNITEKTTGIDIVNCHLQEEKSKDYIYRKEKCSKKSKNKPIFTNKRGRKRKLKRLRKEFPLDFSLSVKSHSSELFKNEETGFSTKVKVTDKEDFKMCNTQLSEETDFISYSYSRNNKKDEEAEKKITTIGNETKKDCFQPKLKRKETNLPCVEPADQTNENEMGAKKQRTLTPSTEELPTQVSTSNICEETASNASYGCMNQAFLWNKISGFLNKITRNVGTQVKLKRVGLKGFETAEPEISLQNEVTLPQVIKALFEELKSTDSSLFSDV